MLKLKRAAEFANWLRAYHVLVDGERVAKIRNGRQIAVEIAAGHHTVELELDWCRSNRVDIEVRDGRPVRLRCGSNYRGLGLFRGVGRMITDPKDYLWLRPAANDGRHREGNP